jgi:hypothetical protein
VGWGAGCMGGTLGGAGGLMGAGALPSGGEHLTYAMSINTQDVADASRGA